MLSAERRGVWRGRAWAARLLQVLIVASPIALGVGVSFVLAGTIPAPTSTAVRWAEVVAIAVVGVGVMRLATGLTQRLLPLSTLLGLTLVFPDSTPSRMRVAMRVSSEARLREIVERTRTHGFPADPSLAAERILELV